MHTAESLSPDRYVAQQRIAGFNPEISPACRALGGKFGSTIKDEVLCIAEVLGAEIGIYPDRDAKRRKIVLLKWYDENWERIQPFLGRIMAVTPRGGAVWRDFAMQAPAADIADSKLPDAGLN
jgi:hypothetical protein